MLLSQIFDQTPAERRAFMQEQGEPTHRANAAQEARDMNATNTRPPTAHTHRGKPRAWEMDGYHEATKTKRTPTHRGTPRPENIPPWVQMLQAHADQAERNRDA